MTSHGLLRRTGSLAIAALLTGSVLGLLTASPAAADTSPPSLGTVSFFPGKGIAAEPIRMTTSGPCPADAEHVIGYAYGNGFPARGQIVLTNSSAGFSRSSDMELQLANNFTILAQMTGAKLSGPYKVVVSCIDRLFSKTFGTFTGTLTFAADGASWTASSVAPAPADWIGPTASGAPAAGPGGSSAGSTAPAAGGSAIPSSAPGGSSARPGGSSSSGAAPGGSGQPSSGGSASSAAVAPGSSDGSGGDPGGAAQAAASTSAIRSSSSWLPMVMLGLAGVLLVAAAAWMVVRERQERSASLVVGRREKGA